MVMVSNSNFAQEARSSQVDMLCIIDKYRLLQFLLIIHYLIIRISLAGKKSEFCDLVTLGHLYKIHHTRQFKRAYASTQGTHKNETQVSSCGLGILCLSGDRN